MPAIARNKVIPIRRVRRTQRFGDMTYERAKALSAILLRAIKRELGGATFFNREDLIHLRGFGQEVTSQSRYGKICVLLQFLLESGEVKRCKNRDGSASRTDLCLKSHERLYNNEQLLWDQHYDHIRSVVQNTRWEPSTFAVIDIIGEWKTDATLTFNNKRVAVRHAVTKLLNDGIITRHDEYEFRVAKK